MVGLCRDELPNPHPHPRRPAEDGTLSGNGLGQQTLCPQCGLAGSRWDAGYSCRRTKVSTRSSVEAPSCWGRMLRVE